MARPPPREAIPPAVGPSGAGHGEALPFNRRRTMTLTDAERADLAAVVGLPPLGVGLLLTGEVQAAGQAYWRGRGREAREGSGDRGKRAPLSQRERRLRGMANAIRNGRRQPRSLGLSEVEALAGIGDLARLERPALAGWDGLNREGMAREVEGIADDLKLWADPSPRYDTILQSFVDRLAKAWREIVRRRITFHPPAKDEVEALRERDAEFRKFAHAALEVVDPAAARGRSLINAVERLLRQERETEPLMLPVLSEGGEEVGPVRDPDALVRNDDLPKSRG